MSGGERDAVIIGASFAGLAAARFITDGRALILERKKELGTAQKSTCCTSLGWMERLGCRAAVLKTFDYLTIYSGNGNCARARLPETFCTIDYQSFCTTLADNLSNSEVMCGKKVLGLEKRADGFRVMTKGGAFTGRTVVNASGWPGIGAVKNPVHRERPAYGLEMETAFDGDHDSFHIFYGKKYIPRGYGWIFPTSKDTARIGLGGFLRFRPFEALERFYGELGVKTNGQRPHGGYLPLKGLRKPVRDGVFIVGDACSQVLPLSGEGIRKAFEYSELCGTLITKVLRGEITLSEGLSRYETGVLGARRFYDNMRFIQTLALYCPDWGRNRIIGRLSKTEPARLEGILRSYLNGSITGAKTGILRTVLKGIRG